MPAEINKAIIRRPAEDIFRGTRVVGDAGANHVMGYSAAEAAHIFEEFLELHLSHTVFWAWLQSYPYTPGGPPDLEVEDEINHATLALLAFEKGTRSWREVEQELIDSRARLTGLARY